MVKAIKFNALLLVLTLITTAEAAQPFQIVSDVDDTVKISDVQYPLDSVFRSLFKKEFFAGMSALYQELAANSRANGLLKDTRALEFVSGSPKLIEKQVRAALIAEKFPSFNLTVRSNILEDVAIYKERIFEQLAGKNDVGFIFLGDDTEKDPEATTHFRMLHQERTLAIYIHNVMNKVVRPGTISYFTAFDVALHEVEAGRLEPTQAIRVGQAVLKEKTERIFPNFAVCPLTTEGLGYDRIETGSRELDDFKTAVSARLVSLCQKRDYIPRSQRGSSGDKGAAQLMR